MNETERFEQMDPEDRKDEARDRIKRMIFMRIVMAAMLVWVIFRFEIPAAMIVLLVCVILLILGTMVPALKVLKTDLKESDEE